MDDPGSAAGWCEICPRWQWQLSHSTHACYAFQPRHLHLHTRMQPHEVLLQSVCSMPAMPQQKASQHGQALCMRISHTFFITASVTATTRVPSNNSIRGKRRSSRSVPAAAAPVGLAAGWPISETLLALRWLVLAALLAGCPSSRIRDLIHSGWLDAPAWNCVAY